MSLDLEPQNITNKFSARIKDGVETLLQSSHRKRLNLVLTERHIERLSRLVQKTDAASIAEVVRQALFVFELLVEKRFQGSVFKELTSKGELFPMELGIDAPPRILKAIEQSSDIDTASRSTTGRRSRDKVAAG